MIVAETALFLAVRNKIRNALSLGENQCDINPDDEVPAIAADKYVSIMGAGTSTGPAHSSSGGVWDLLLNVKVTVYHRIAEVARDRRRDAWDKTMTGLGVDLGVVIESIDFKYDVLTAAQALLVGTPAEGGNYPEPFREFTIDANPIVAVADYDAAPMQSNMNNPIIGIKRSIVFRRARFMRERG